ncbi:alpha/beta fold hydrolase [Actinomycetospora sp. C-140]
MPGGDIGARDPAVAVQRLTVPGGTVPCELRGSGPLLVLVGAPVTRAGYADLADALATDHTVLTSDPRGFGDSERLDHGDLTPGALAGDVAALLDALGTGPARLVGCSGGAIVALTLARARPDLVTGVVAHEPPLVRLLPEDLRDDVEDVRTAFRAGGAAAGMARLDALVRGTDPPPVSPDTGETDRDVASFLGDLLVPALTGDADPAALAAVPGLVAAAGADSRGELPHRCAVALAGRTGCPLVTFPGGHLAASTHPAAFADAVRRSAG